MILYDNGKVTIVSKRCHHQWEPLVKIDPAGMSDKVKFAVAFALGLQHLDGYDRCSLCGRISWVTKSRFRRRKLVSCGTQRLEQRARQFEEWAARQSAAHPATSTIAGSDAADRHAQGGEATP